MDHILLYSNQCPHSLDVLNHGIPAGTGLYCIDGSSRLPTYATHVPVLRVDKPGVPMHYIYGSTRIIEYLGGSSAPVPKAKVPPAGTMGAIPENEGPYHYAHEPEWLQDFDADALADEHGLDSHVVANDEPRDQEIFPGKKSGRDYEAAIANRRSVKDYDREIFS